MGFIAFMIASVVVVALAAVGAWLVSQIPGCPAMVPKIFWIVAVLMILFMLASATGIMSRDPQIPHL